MADRTNRELWVKVAVVMYLPAIDFISRSEGKPSVGKPFSVMVTLTAWTDRFSGDVSIT